MGAQASGRPAPDAGASADGSRSSARRPPNRRSRQRDRAPVDIGQIAHDGQAEAGPWHSFIRTHAPRLGEHNRALLAELGVDDAGYARLVAGGAVCEGTPLNQEEEE